MSFQLVSYERGERSAVSERWALGPWTCLVNHRTRASQGLLAIAGSSYTECAVERTPLEQAELDAVNVPFNKREGHSECLEHGVREGAELRVEILIVERRQGGWLLPPRPR